MAVAECTVCLIAAMDRLWFHQIILFSESKHTSQIQKIYPHDEISIQETDDLEKEDATDDDDERRPTRLKLNLVSAKGRYYSSSPISTQKRSRNHPTLKKSSSCKSLMDLELEEVKGFMDLGFTFRRENLTKRIIHLVPGLQRINGSSEDDDDDDEQQIRKEIIRPYLSEAWVIRKSDSPLLNLRIPTVSTAADMKKHLKYWAHTVASAIHQES